MSNTTLFEAERREVKPSTTRKEPVVWVRRLRLVSNLTPDAELIREIEFRRGLNIICTAIAGAEDQRVVGHSVGKTLLLRLIRYCLGEPAFSTKAVRTAIAAELEQSYVLAEIRVAGTSWVVARPIGLDAARSSSWALEGDDFDMLIANRDNAVKFTDFIVMLEQATTTAFTGVILPHAERPAGWLDLLAWLSRDQECRFRHQAEWRDTDSESRTPQLQLEDASLVMRMAMGLLGDEEKVLQHKHQQFLSDRKQKASEITRLENALDAERENLRRALKIDATAPEGDLFVAMATNIASKKSESLQGLLDEADKNLQAEVDMADQKRTAAITANAALGEAQKETKAKHEAEQVQLGQLEQADAKSYQATFSILGARWCRLAITEAEAMAKGCPGAPVSTLKPGQKDPEQALRIKNCQQHIAELTEKLGKLEADITEKTRECNLAQRAFTAALEKRTQQFREMNQKIGNWQNIEARARQYGSDSARLTKMREHQEALEKKIQESNEMQRAARGRLEANQRRLSEYFDYVLKKLLGPDAGGKIDLEARGIIPVLNGSVAASGQAMSTSSRVLGFDLACLIGYICGVGHLPGLIIHDSPREADMEDALYHRMFNLLADLEPLFVGTEPSFQYIVTTTSPPPESLNRPPYVRVRLDARREEGLLLGRRLSVR